MTRRRSHLDLLAAEYVLGTLTGRARARFERWMRQDIQVAAAVRRWELRLASLGSAAAAIPPANLWKRIEAKLPPVEGASSTRSWTWLAVAATVAALAFGLRGLLPAPPTIIRPPTVVAASPLFSAYLDVDSANAHWWVRADPARGQWFVVALSVPDVPADKDVELWLLAADGRAPISLGLMPRKGSAIHKIADPSLLQGAKLALSLEPAGGSATGAPTGPVLTAAALEKIV